MSRDATHESESETRRKRGGTRLTAQGWKVVPRPKAIPSPQAIEEYETDSGPADYALQVDGRILGVVEAKRLTKGPQNVLTQAERYAKGLSS
ncbi:MAG: restriction endonuclease subunit R, partial [Planctomycetes bacterium]|nr:restriction endonuclease subunit R [Planctomycetota bacterium]